MSGRCTGWVLRNGPQDRAMRSVLIVIADAANSDGEHAHPGIANMIEGSLYSRTTVFRVLDRLEADGWVRVTQRGSRTRATVFDVLMDRVDESHGGTRHDVDGSHGDLDESHRPLRRVPPDDTPTTTTTVDTTGSSPHGDAAGDRNDPSYRFEDFWKAYPARSTPSGARTKGAKSVALQRWRRLPYETKALVFRAVKHYALNAVDPEFKPPDAYRWLGRKEWEGWLDPPASTSTVRALVDRPPLGCEHCEYGFVDAGSGLTPCPHCNPGVRSVS